MKIKRFYLLAFDLISKSEFKNKTNCVLENNCEFDWDAPYFSWYWKFRRGSFVRFLGEVFVK